MDDRRPALLALALLAAATLLLGTTVTIVANGPELTPTEQLGRSIFFDETLSLNGNQSCASCHDPEAGWAGGLSAINAHGAVYEGSVPGEFGNRKPPTSAYATFAPVLHFENEKHEEHFVGGNFWNGRATGEILGSPTAEQAKGPFLNPVEQALGSADDLVSLVCAASYGDLFRQVWGADTCDPANVAVAYDRIGLSVAAYEGSFESNAFTSKYDAWLAGKADLTKEERQGLNFFKGKGKCSRCHILDEEEDGTPPLLTDFTFDNLGLPRNPENPVYQYNPGFIDFGLGGFLQTRPDYAEYAEANYGKHKVPTLRNVAKAPAGVVKAFGHNGYFKSLESIVHFYSTRDVKPICPGDYTEAQALAGGCWPVPEVAENVNTRELGRLHLTPAQEAAIVAFLGTLSDGYMAQGTQRGRTGR